MTYVVVVVAGFKFCQRLNLLSIVSCRLDPLRFCLPVVANKFASITRFVRTTASFHPPPPPPLMYLSDTLLMIFFISQAIPGGVLRQHPAAEPHEDSGSCFNSLRRVSRHFRLSNARVVLSVRSVRSRYVSFCPKLYKFSQH